MKILTRISIAVVVIVALWAAWVYLSGRRHPAPRFVVVCIDPGHPSETNSGRTMQHGTNETRINWEVALKLEKELARDKRIKVIKTREIEGQFMRNRDRAILANEANAAIVVHLHCDAGPSKGFTVYYPDRAAVSECVPGPSKSVLRSSRRAARVIHASMKRKLRGLVVDHGLFGETRTLIGSKVGGLTTSVWSRVPTVTIEMVFLSNASDARFIKSEEGQNAMAAAIADGVRRFIGPKLRKVKR